MTDMLINNDEKIKNMLIICHYDLTFQYRAYILVFTEVMIINKTYEVEMGKKNEKVTVKENIVVIRCPNCGSPAEIDFVRGTIKHSMNYTEEDIAKFKSGETGDNDDNDDGERQFWE